MLEELGFSNELKLIDSRSRYRMSNWLPYSGLLVMHAMSGKNASLTYHPRIKTRKDLSNSFHQEEFYRWWNSTIFNDKQGGVFTRKTLILSIAAYEGTAPFASFFRADFNNLTRYNSLGWTYNGKYFLGPTVKIGGGIVKNKDSDDLIKPDNQPDLVAIRAITQEFLISYSQMMLRRGL